MSNLELISILVCIAALFGWISSRWLRLPITLGTMSLTIAASAALLGMRTLMPGLLSWASLLVKQIDFAGFLLHGMLPLLLFGGAFLLDLKALAAEKLLVGVLSVPGTVLSFLTVAALMHTALQWFGLNAGWLPCLFFGAVISPTDPIAVLELLSRIGVPRAIQAQLAGESLFNDGVGAVLFIALIDVTRGATPSARSIVLLLLLKAGGSMVLATLLGWMVALLVRLVRQYELEIILSLALALAGYALAERLHLSAPLEAVVAGIAFRRFTRDYTREISHDRLRAFWEASDHIQNSVLFVLLGMGVLAIPFDRRVIAPSVAAVVAVTAVRAAVVASLVTLVCHLLQRGHRSSVRLLTWGGLRGGLSIALALSIPHSASQPWILPATYVVVVVSILLQGGSMGLFMRPAARDESSASAVKQYPRSRVSATH